MSSANTSFLTSGGQLSWYSRQVTLGLRCMDLTNGAHSKPAYLIQQITNSTDRPSYLHDDAICCLHWPIFPLEHTPGNTDIKPFSKAKCWYRREIYHNNIEQRWLYHQNEMSPYVYLQTPTYVIHSWVTVPESVTCDQLSYFQIPTYLIHLGVTSDAWMDYLGGICGAFH